MSIDIENQVSGENNRQFGGNNVGKDLTQNIGDSLNLYNQATPDISFNCNHFSISLSWKAILVISFVPYNFYISIKFLYLLD